MSAITEITNQVKSGEANARQQVLAAAWADYGKSNPPADDKAFLDGWMKARATALANAKMLNGFDQ